MFKGIIEDTSTVKNLKNQESNLLLEIGDTSLHQELRIGDSIAIDGVCQTVIAKSKNSFRVQAIPETLQKTNFSTYQKGTTVNLERAMKLGDRIDGHLVQGHIDLTTEIIEIKKNLALSKKPASKNTGSKNSAGQTTLTLSLPHSIKKYLAYKGSITINGVSLTVSDLQTDTFSVSLIPHTLKTTNLSLLKKGSLVNLEVDLIARYLERMLEKNNQSAKYEWLAERNFI